MRRDPTGLHWVYALPGAWFLVAVVERVQRGWDDDPTSLVYISGGPPELSWLQILFVTLSLVYLAYPTILGWALVTVPCVLFFVRTLSSVHIDDDFSLVLQLALGLFCFGLWRYRPKHASRRAVFASVTVALACEGILFGPAIWNTA